MTAILAGIVLSACVMAQAPQSADSGNAKNSKWTVDDIINSEQAGQFQISPDCRWAAWVKTTSDKEKDSRVSNIFLSSLTEKKETQLTRGTDNNFSPKWSPDGQLLAFISSRTPPKSKEGDGGESHGPQIWLINPNGGEAWALTDSTRAVTSFEWAGTGKIVYAAEEDPGLYENKVKHDKDTSIVVEDEQHAPPVRLFQVVLKTKKVTRLTDNTDRIEGLAVSRDGSKAVTTNERSLRFIYDNKIKPVVFFYDLNTGNGKQIFNDPKFNVGRVRWTPDGKGFYAASSFTH
ncbi:MAG TPA: hypothetical protein VI756_04050, partial [Blastocatellia bacterium]